MRGDPSPLHRIAQRGALAAYLRGEATECRPKPRTFIFRCARKETWELAYSKCQEFFPNYPENPLFEKSRLPDLPGKNVYHIQRLH